jgi:hypothetical protein
MHVAIGFHHSRRVAAPIVVLSSPLQAGRPYRHAGSGACGPPFPPGRSCARASRCSLRHVQRFSSSTDFFVVSHDRKMRRGLRNGGGTGERSGSLSLRKPLRSAADTSARSSASGSKRRARSIQSSGLSTHRVRSGGSSCEGSRTCSSSTGTAACRAPQQGAGWGARGPRPRGRREGHGCARSSTNPPGASSGRG